MMLPLLAALLAPTTATAADEDPGEMANRAMELFKSIETRGEGLALYHKALGKAAGKVRIGILKNLGKAYGGMDRYAEAWPYLHFAFLSEGGADLKIREALDFVRKKLSLDHAQVRVETVPARSVVTFAGEGGPHRFRTPATWWFPPGMHTIKVTHDGYLAKTTTIKVKKGVPFTETVTLKEIQVAVPVKTGAGAGIDTNTVTKKTTVRRVPAWKWALLGGGLALAAGGGATWMVGWDRAGALNDEFSGHVAPEEVDARTADYDQRWENEVVPFQLSSYVLWGVGGAAAITGLVLLLADGPPPARPAPEAGPSAGLLVLPAVWGDGGGVLLGHWF